jgi:hypothetical protein
MNYTISWTVTVLACFIICGATDPFSRYLQSLEGEVHAKQHNIPCPKIYISDGSGYDESPLGTLILHSLLHDSENGRVYEAQVDRGEQVVVKYVNDCFARLERGMTVNPLVWENAVMSSLSEAGIAPKNLFLSRRALIKQTNAPILRRNMTPFFLANKQSCIDFQSTVRFLVHEPVGPTLSSYFEALSHNNDPSFALKVFASVRQSLELLHKLSATAYTHGDIHFGNIAFKRVISAEELMAVNPAHEELVLLNFQFATSSVFANRFAIASWPPRGRALEQLSPWQLEGFPQGPRDDVYRLFFQMARVLSKNNFGLPAVRSGASQDEAVEVWRRFHDNGNFFEKLQEIFCIQHPQRYCSITAELNFIVMYIRALPQPQSPIDYMFLSKKLGSLMSILE